MKPKKLPVRITARNVRRLPDVGGLWHAGYIVGLKQGRAEADGAFERGYTQGAEDTRKAVCEHLGETLKEVGE